MKLLLQHGAKGYEVDVPDAASGGDLKVLMEELSGVLARKQKLIFKGKVINDGEPLAAKNVKEGAKLMLMATTQTKGQAMAEMVAKEKAALAKDRPALTENPASTAPKPSAGALPSQSVQARAAMWAKTGVVGLRDSGLETLPPEIWTLGPSARVADLGGNALQTLPSDVSRLTSLQKLRLSRNALTDVGFPGGFGMLERLVTLALDHNRLSSLPPPLLRLTSLQDLNLADNALTTLPGGISVLSALSRLDLRNNSLETLPAELAECVGLETLDAAHNRLTALPPQLGRLPSLRELLLDSNRLRGVPAEILRGCSALCTLSLHGNPITMEALRDSEGFSEFNARRVAKYDKQMESGVMAPSQGFDEGADAIEWQSWTYKIKK